MRGSANKRQDLRAEAERLWGWSTRFVDEQGLLDEDGEVDDYGYGDDLWHIRKPLSKEAGAPWAASGGSRIVVPLSRVDERFIVKMGWFADQDDEQTRWLNADHSARRWLLPIIDFKRGAWSIFPRAKPLPPRMLQTTHFRGYAGKNRPWRHYREVHPGVVSRAVRSSPLIAQLVDDIQGPRNWGLYRGRPVILDYGDPEVI
mgnify:CR=1 FL=1